jgi:hypothetical protein
MNEPARRYLPCWCCFKDKQCGYVGPETYCDKTIDRCRELGNEINFRGWPVSDALPEPPK